MKTDDIENVKPGDKVDDVSQSGDNQRLQPGILV
jgi:hypothetical protein